MPFYSYLSICYTSLGLFPAYDGSNSYLNWYGVQKWPEIALKIYRSTWTLKLSGVCDSVLDVECLLREWISFRLISSVEYSCKFITVEEQYVRITSKEVFQTSAAIFKINCHKIKEFFLSQSLEMYQLEEWNNFRNKVCFSK